MATSEDHRPDEGTGRLVNLVEVWARRDPFDDWVRGVSEAFFASRLRLEGAAKLLDTTPVELQAVLNLATLEDDELELISRTPPPKTTWLTLALASHEGIDAAIAALRTMAPGASPYHTVQDAVHAIEGPSALERVAALPGPVLISMGSKAKQYGLLGPNHRKAIVDMGIRKRTGRPLTPRQTAYIYSLLQQLVEGGAVRRDSPDDDQGDCDAVLDALGV